MAETNTEVEGKPGSREPSKAHAAESVDMNKLFMDKLSKEGKTGDESPGALDDRGGEKRSDIEGDQEQSRGKLDVADDRANEQNKSESEKESLKLDPKITIEVVDDDNKIVGYADDDGHDYDLKGVLIESEPDKDQKNDQAASEGEGEESDSVRVTEALQVDDRQYTPDDVRELNTKVLEHDADYRRKTQVMARLREEYAVQGQDLETIGSFFKNLTQANVKSLESMDTKGMDQETFSTWRSNYDSAKSGASTLERNIEGMLSKLGDAREKMKDNAASESVEIMKSIEPRWDNEFYTKVRDYAVQSNRYSAESFGDLTDWRTMEGLVALMDRDAVLKGVAGAGNGKSETIQRDKRKRRRQNRRLSSRNASGRFQTHQQTALKSTNAKGDGSLRQMLHANLERERTTR